jgi:hypothetical protein
VRFINYILNDPDSWHDLSPNTYTGTVNLNTLLTYLDYTDEVFEVAGIHVYSIGGAGTAVTIREFKLVPDTPFPLAADNDIYHINRQALPWDGDGKTPQTAKSASINFIHEKALLDDTDIAVHWGATKNYYSDADFSVPQMMPLGIASGGTADLYIKVTAEDGGEQFFILSVHRSYSADEPSSWARPEIVSAIQRGIVPEDLRQGYRDSINRLQFSQLSVALIEYALDDNIANIVANFPGATNPSFNDTADPSALALAAMGIVSGTGDGNFNPTGILNRAQLATFLGRIMERVLGYADDIAAAPPAGFTDMGNSTWAVPYVNYLTHIGVLTGAADPNTFNPDGQITLEESIVTCEQLAVWLDVPGYDHGHVLGRSTITVADASLAFRAFLGLATLTSRQYEAATLGEGALTMVQVLRIFRFALGLTPVL